MIDVPPTTFDRINSGSGPHLDFTMLGAFSEPALDGRDLWSPGQEAVVFVTLLICPYDSSFILPDIYVVPLTCTLEAQMLPELSDVKARGVFVCLPKRWQVSHPPATWSCHVTKISLKNQEQEAFAEGRGGCRSTWSLCRAGVWGHLNLQELQPQHPTRMLLSGWAE